MIKNKYKAKVVISLVILFVIFYPASYLLLRAMHRQQWDMGDKVEDLVWYPPSHKLLYFIHYPLFFIDKFATKTHVYLGNTPFGKSDKCPVCGNTNGIHIIRYGFGMDGGCVVTPDRAKFKCKSCQHEWSDYNESTP